MQLVAATTPNGRWYDTMLADAQGGMILSPGISEVLLPADTADVSNRQELPARAEYETNQDSFSRILMANDAPVEIESRRADAAPRASGESKEETSVIIGLVTPPNGQERSADLRIPPGVQVFQIGGIPVLNLFLDRQSPTGWEITRLFEALVRPRESGSLENFQDLEGANVNAASDIPLPAISADADSNDVLAKLFAQPGDDGDFCDLLP